MNLKLLLVAVVAGAATTLVAATFNNSAPRTPARPAPISGDYVESRSCTVYCGACHYNGELVSTGHDAVLAWSFTTGDYHGTSLAGLRAMAEVTCAENLGLHETPHHAQLLIDTSASPAQVAALTALLQEKCGTELGHIDQVTRAPISFLHNDTGYTVKGEGFAQLTVSYRTDDGCCQQPGLVWYSPLSPLASRKVGFTEFVSYTGTLAPPWSQSGDDSAIYGPLAF